LCNRNYVLVRWHFEPALSPLCLGFDPQQGLPDRDSILKRVHLEDRTSMLDYVERALRERRDYAVEFRIVLADITVRHLYGLGHSVFTESGELVEVAGTQMDVTERKRAEEEHERLRQLEAELARMDRISTIGELTASLAHELNQPIAAVLTDASTCLSWLKRKYSNPEEACEAASRVVTDATRDADIIARIRAMFTKSIPERSLVDVNEVIREMMRLLRN